MYGKWVGMGVYIFKKGGPGKTQKPPKREWHLVDNCCCEDNHSNQLKKHGVLVVSVNQPWKQSEHLLLCYWLCGNTSKIFHVLTDCDIPLENFTAWSTHARVLRREDLYNVSQTLFQNPRVVELILGSIHMHQCLLMTLILASEAAVKTTPSYEPKQLGKTNITQTCIKMCVCVSGAWLFETKTNSPIMKNDVR